MTTNPLARFDRADRAAMTATICEWAALPRIGTTADHVAPVVATMLDDRAARFPAWALIAAAADIARPIVERHGLTPEVADELLTADLPLTITGPAEAFLLGAVYRRGAPQRQRIDEAITEWGAVHAIDGAAVMLTAIAALDGPDVLARIGAEAFADYARMTTHPIPEGV